MGIRQEIFDFVALAPTLLVYRNLEFSKSNCSKTTSSKFCIKFAIDNLYLKRVLQVIKKVLDSFSLNPGIAQTTRGTVLIDEFRHLNCCCQKSGGIFSFSVPVSSIPVSAWSWKLLTGFFHSRILRLQQFGIFVHALVKSLAIYRLGSHKTAL